MVVDLEKIHFRCCFEDTHLTCQLAHTDMCHFVGRVECKLTLWALGGHFPGGCLGRLCSSSMHSGTVRFHSFHSCGDRTSCCGHTCDDLDRFRLVGLHHPLALAVSDTHATCRQILHMFGFATMWAGSSHCQIASIKHMLCCWRSAPHWRVLTVWPSVAFRNVQMLSIQLGATQDNGLASSRMDLLISASA